MTEFRYDHKIVFPNPVSSSFLPMGSTIGKTKEATQHPISQYEKQTERWCTVVHYIALCYCIILHLTALQCIALYFDITKSHWQAGYCYLWQCNVVHCKYSIAWGPQPIKSHKNYEPVWKAVYCAPSNLHGTLITVFCTL